MDKPLPPMNPEVARLRRQSAQRKYRKRMRHVRLLWVIAGVLFVMFFIEVLIALCFSSRFWIYRISVRGQETLTPAEVIRLMNLPEHSNFYRVSQYNLEKRLRAEQRIKSAEVKHGKIGTLLVKISERQAVCQLGFSSPQLYMDANGYVFTRPIPPMTPIPVAEGVKTPSIKRILGKRLNTEPTRIVLDCLRELQQASEETNLDIAHIAIINDKRVDLILRQGTSIHLGPPDELASKAWGIKQTIIQASKEGHSLEQIGSINVEFFNAETGVGSSFSVRKNQEETTQP